MHAHLAALFHKVVAVAAATTGLVLVSAGAASADQIVIEVPQQSVSALPRGTLYLLAERGVAREHQGLVCSGQIAAQNNASIHPGNHLRVSTGTSEVVLNDVEGSANKITPLATPITLGSLIRIHLIMGPDEWFSGGLLLELQCEMAPPPPPPPPPPSPPPPSTGDNAGQGGVSSPGEPTTTVPPTPTGGADAGGRAPGVVAAQSPARAAPQQLPATGPGEALLAGAVGMLLLGLGGALTAVARRSPSVRD